MGFFKKLFKNKIFKAILPIAATVLTGNPMIGAAIGGGLGASGGGGIVGGLTGAAGGYFGGSALSGAMAGAAGLPAGGIIGPTAGGLGGAISGAGAGVSGAASALGIGGGLLSNASNLVSALGLAQQAMPQKQTLAKQKIGDPTPVEEKFTPVRPAAATRPMSLNDLSGFSPEQERSALATRGLNTGLGGEEQSYYQNLVQRSLIGDGGQINTENPNFLMPIESSYFSRRGKNTSNINQFLRQLA